MSSVLNDLRFALRQLRKAPGFTITAVATLALGIGISAAMFTVVDGVLLRPLPVPHPSEVVALGEANVAGGFDSSSLPNVKDWKAENHSFQDIAWYTQAFFNLKKPDGSVNFSLNTETSPTFFSTLQAQPFLGRTFLPQDVHGGTGEVAVLSYNVWSNYFDHDPAILGKHVQLGAATYTVIGVMPRRFYIPINDDGPVVWTLLVPNSSMARDDAFLSVIGRLKPGVSIASAKAELNGLQGNIAQQYASMALTKHVAMQSYRESLVGGVSSALLALQGAVLLVWLIACANVAGLLLTRMSARRREIAVRAALGAGRERIVRQFLTESLLLSFVGGAVGLAIAMGCLITMHRTIGAHLSRSSEVSLNWHVVVLLIALSIFSAIIFGVLPAFQAASSNPQEALHQGTLAAGSGLGEIRLRNLLIVGELGLSLVLLFTAGLMLRTLYALRNVQLGFNQQNLVSAQFFPLGGFTVPEKTLPIVQTLYVPLLQRARSLPGVESADLISGAPLSANVHMTDGFKVIGYPDREDHTAFGAVTPGIFRTLGIPLKSGRIFNAQDTKTSPAVCIVNQAFVREFFPGKNPIDQKLALDDDPKSKSIYTHALIAGVVGDTPEGKVGTAAAPLVYVDMDQVKQDDPYYPLLALAMELVVRTHREPQTLIPSVRRIFSEVAPGVSVNAIQTYREKIDGQLGSQALAAKLLWLFAIAAVLISAAGLYGLLSYSVAQRTREIGVRLALGAQREDILRAVLRQASGLLLSGIAIGLICAFFIGRFVRSFLYGVNQHDGATLVVVAFILGAVGLLAAYIPAWRASRIEPTEALRTE